MEMNVTDFPVQVKLSIDENEMAASGHVRNIHFVKYFESARIQYLQRIGIDELKVKTGIGVILAQTVCQYLKPLAYPDQIIVGARVKTMSKSSFVMEYIIVSEKNGVSASGVEVIVIYNYNDSKKAELPLVVKNVIENIESRVI